MPATGLSLETDTALALSQVQIRPIDSPLIANYTFNGDTSGWIAVTGATLSVVDSRLRVTVSSGQSGARVEVPTVIGKQYRITGSSFAGTASSREFRIGTTVGGTGIANVVDGNLDVTFTATTTTTHVYCRITGPGYADFDDIYFRQELREADTAISLTVLELKSIGLSTETNTALNTSFLLSNPVGTVLEADVSLSLSGLNIRAVGFSTETDTSLDLTEVLIGPVGRSSETEIAIAEGLGLGFTTATETDTGLTLGYIQAGTVKMAEERNYSWPSGPNASIDFIDGYSSMFGKNLRNYPPKAFQLSHKRLKTFTSPSFSKGRPR